MDASSDRYVHIARVVVGVIDLAVVVESDEYYRSSRVPLEAQDAPRTTSLELRNLPSGTYEVRGALIDGVGHDRAAVRTRVIVLESAASDERDEGPL